MSSLGYRLTLLQHGLKGLFWVGYDHICAPKNLDMISDHTCRKPGVYHLAGFSGLCFFVGQVMNHIQNQAPVHIHQRFDAKPI